MVAPVSHPNVHEANRRTEFRVPVQPVPSIQVYLWTEHRKFAVELLDASPSGVLVSVPSLSELSDEELQLLVLEVTHKQSHFVISGSLVRRGTAELAMQFEGENLSTFVASNESRRQWNAFVIWLQSVWIREQKLTDTIHGNS